MNPFVFFALWFTLGLLAGGMISLTALAILLLVKRVQGALMVGFVAGALDVIFLIFFLIWPAQLGSDLGYFAADYIFFPSMFAAMLFFYITFNKAKQKVLAQAASHGAKLPISA